MGQHGSGCVERLTPGRVVLDPAGFLHGTAIGVDPGAGRAHGHSPLDLCPGGGPRRVVGSPGMLLTFGGATTGFGLPAAGFRFALGGAAPGLGLPATGLGLALGGAAPGFGLPAAGVIA